MILIPKYSTHRLELPRTMARFSGHFKMETFKTDSWDKEIPGSRRVRAEFENLILNQGFNYMSEGPLGVTGFMTEVAVGTGTSQPSLTETGLQAFVAGDAGITSSTTTAEGTAPFYGSRTHTWRFDEGQAEGILAEVGVGRDNTSLNGTDLFSRARIQVAGVDGTIEVLADEWLDVTYQLRMYPGVLVDATGTIDISGVSTDYVLRNAQVASSTQWGFTCGHYNFPENPSLSPFFTGYEATSVLGDTESSPSGASIGMGSTYSSGTYNVDTFNQDMNMSIGLTEGNLTGGIGTMLWNTNLGAIQMSFDPPIDKDATKVFDMNMNYAWAAVAIP